MHGRGYRADVPTVADPANHDDLPPPSRRFTHRRNERAPFTMRQAVMSHDNARTLWQRGYGIKHAIAHALIRHQP